MKWIKFEDKLPEDYQWVLAFDSSDATMRVVYYIPSQSQIPSWMTHWMPLPEPPKP